VLDVGGVISVHPSPVLPVPGPVGAPSGQAFELLLRADDVSRVGGIDELLGKLRRGNIGVVHLEGVEKQEKGRPRATVRLLDEPVEGSLGAVEHGLSSTVLLVGVETLPEAESGADVATVRVGLGPVAGPDQQSGQGRNVVRQPANTALAPVGHTMSRRVETREQRHVRRRRLGRLAECPLEENALTRQPTDLRAGRALVSVSCQMICPQGVDRNKDQIGPRRFYRLVARQARSQKPSGRQDSEYSRSRTLSQALSFRTDFKHVAR